MAASFTLSTIFSAIDRVSGPARTIFGKVDKSAKSSTRGIAAAGKGMASFARFARVAVAAVATGALAKGVNTWIEKGDEIAKTARMLGLNAEALQELRFASDREGVSAESLTVGFRQLNKNVGDLRLGTGSLFTQLSRSNPALARQLRTVNNSEEAFTLLIDAIDKEPTAIRKASLAQAAFGRSGQELIKLAAGGTDGLKALREEARKYGNVMSEDATKGAEFANDAITNLKASLWSLAQGPMAKLLEIIGPLIQRTADWLAANRGMISSGIDTFFSKVVRVFETVGPVVGEALGKLSAIIPPLLELLDPILGIFVALSPLIITAAEAISAVLVPALQLLKPILDAIGAVLRFIVPGLQNVTALAGGVTGGLLSGGDPNADVLGRTPVSPQAASTEARTLSEMRSTVDVNFNSPPPGTAIVQRGRSPGVNVNTGPAFGRTF